MKSIKELEGESSTTKAQKYNGNSDSNPSPAANTNFTPFGGKGQQIG